MSAFRPSRSSPPVRTSPEPSTSVSAAAAVLVPELTGLSTDDVELLDTIITRAGETATTFLTVFKAYSDILQERGLDTTEVVYYGKLLKLGTLKGRNWLEKWNMVKNQYGYTRSKPHTKPSLPTALLTERPAAAFRHPTLSMRDDDDVFTVSNDNESAWEQASAAPLAARIHAHPALARARARQQQRPSPSDVTSNSLGLDFGESASAAPIRRDIPQNRLRRGSEASTADPFGPVPSTTPPSYRAAAHDHLIARQALELVRRSNGIASGSRAPAPPAISLHKSLADPDDPWKKIRLAQDEQTADEYYITRVLERCWHVWRDGFNWILTTHDQIQEARDNIILARYLNAWSERTTYQHQLSANVAVVADRRCVKTAFAAWKKQFVSRQHAKWRESMRGKMKVVRKKQEQRLRKDAWAKWRQSYKSHLSDQHYNERLVLRVYQAWRKKLGLLDRLEELADQVLRHEESQLKEDAWNHWRRMTQLRLVESALSERIGFRLKTLVIERWHTQIHDLNAADEYFNLIILKRFMTRWSHAVQKVRHLERRATRHIARQDDVLLRAVARVWKARERGRLIIRVKSMRLLKCAWSTWIARGKQQRRHEELAVRFYSQSSYIVSTSFQKWRQILATHRNANEFAVQRYSSQLSQRTMLVWRIRWIDQLKLAKKGIVLERYFLMRRCFNKMHSVLTWRRLEHKFQSFCAKKTGRMLQLWSQRAQSCRALRLAEEHIATNRRHKMMRSTLTQWTNRVIDVKEREINTKQHYEAKILMNALDKWEGQLNRVKEGKSLLFSYRTVKDEDHTKRAFRHWLSMTRTAQDRKLLLMRLEDKKKLALIVGAWEQWRERYKEEQLRPIEYRFLFQAHHNSMRYTMNRWKAQTKSVPAIHFNAVRTKTKAWKVWINQMPRAQLAKKARDIDRKNILSRFMEEWRQAYRTKITRKTVDRARLLRLPTASSTPRPGPSSRPEMGALGYRGIFPPRRPGLPERTVIRDNSPPPLAFGTRKPLFLNRPRSEASPPRSSYRAAPSTREPSPTRSSRSALAVATRASRVPPAPRSTVSVDEPSKLWLELREVQSRAKRSSEQSWGLRSP